MSKSGLLSSISNALKGLGLKAPWKLTGPVSSPEYLSHLPKATEYRVVAPGSQAIRVAIPQAEPEHVYDIKYFVRDSRRVEGPGGTMKLVPGEVDPRAKDDSIESGVTAGTPFRYPNKLRPITDNENNGYTL